MDVKGVIKEISLHQACPAVCTEIADFSVAHLAGGEACHDSVLKAEGGIDVIDRTISTATSCGS